MVKCLYCNSFINYQISDLVCVDHLWHICYWCFCIHSQHLQTYKGCSKLCEFKLFIHDKRNHVDKCELCGTFGIIHHCAIPIKNKYMNVNVL